jgi:hypothetical protein
LAVTGLIANFPRDGVVTINRLILKPEYTVDDLQERVAVLCENGNEEIAYEMLWSGKAYNREQARAARAAKERFAGAGRAAA